MDHNWADVLTALHSGRPVQGLTHGFYKYPARFSPEFVRSVIREFSQPGQVVFDPFMGGGTVIVEAVALGRKALGFDINPLSFLLTVVKTTPLSQRDVGSIRRWADDLAAERCS